MRKHISAALLAGVMLVALCCCQPGFATELSGSLDGRVFIVETGDKGENANARDILLFLNGQFISTFCHKHHGFRQGIYTVLPIDGGLSFSADCFSEKRGVMHWEGTIRGTRIEVTYIWRDRPRWYRPWTAVDKGWARSLPQWDQPGPSTAAEAAETSRQLDGRVYYAQAGMQGTTSDHEDYLIFWDGKFASSTCVEDTFRTSSYSVSEQGDELHFHAEMLSTKYGMMIWDGVINGNRINAVSRWMHTHWFWKIDREYLYQGVKIN